ncbi:hypothetical protein BH11CYA1_BH11CYA1_14350 [soil metagenome]
MGSPAASVPNSESAAVDSYPRITAMESAILGKSYANEALPARLSRMEVKAFGKATDKADLSDRTDSLQDYVEGTLHKQMVVPGPGYQESDDDRPPASASGNVEHSEGVTPAVGSYPRVTALEQAILEQTYESDTLADRLARMETKAFAKAMPAAALGDRTDALEDYAEKKLHKKILGQSSTTVDSAESGGNAAASGGGGGGSFLSKAASALLGVPLNGMPAAGGSSFFAPGFGPFAGMRVRQRTAADASQQGAQANASSNSQSNAPASHQPSAADLAIIDAVTPPAPSVRLATKVGWCEQRVFGQVSYEKHLTDRLSLLNDALKYDPGKKGLDLMDDIDKLIKAALSSKSKQ